MMRTWIAVVVAGAMVVISQPVAAELVLRMTLQLPITNVLGQNVSAFKEIVERESGGEIKVDIHPSAELYKGKEVPHAVSSGAIELGVAPVTSFSHLTPAVNLFHLPFLFDSNEDIAAATGLPAAVLHRQLDVLEWERWLVSDARGYSFVARVPRDIVAQDMVTDGQRQRFLRQVN